MAMDLGDLLDDEDSGPVEVQVFPSKADGLASTEPGGEHQRVQRSESVSGDPVQEPMGLDHGLGIGSLRVLGSGSM